MRFIIILSLLLFVNPVKSQSISGIAGNKPKLIVIAVIDQMRYDYLYRFSENFSEKGFKKLINEGTVCKNTKHNYLLTQQLPGYVTILSGTEPTNHGIVSDQWISRVNNEVINAGVDEKTQPVGADNKNLIFSPKHLRTSFFSDELHLSNNGQSKIFSIAIDGNVAAISGGHTANGAYWFDYISGNWVTSSFYCDSLPQWVHDFNNKKLADVYINRKWIPLQPEKEETDSEKKSVKSFIYNLINKKKITNNYRVIKPTPFGNTLTKDFAISTIIHENLGSDNATDILIVGFNSSGYINEKHGPMSKEIADTYHRLDRDLAHFLEFLDNTLGKENIVFLLTADRGTGYSPQYLTNKGISAGEFNHKKMLAVLKSYLNIIYGKGEWIQNYNAKQIYLNHQLIEDTKVDLYDMQEKIARFLIQFSEISHAIPAITMQRSSFFAGTNYLMQNSFQQQRSGDIIINLEPGWIEKTDKKVLQNSGYNYDVHVPLVWYGWKIPQMVIFRDIKTSDIAVTLSEFLKIAPPNGSSGTVIEELLGR